jgi:hypothetical protein
MPTAVKKPRLFHAAMHVVRVEQWCVEAETPEQARELLARGMGHRCSPGEALHTEVHELLEE